MTRILSVGLAMLVCALLAPSVRGDIFILENGGELRGEFVNPKELPRIQYIINTAGGQITLEEAQVKKVVPQNAREMEYDRIHGNYADTVDGQWELAEWCRENSLPEARKTHLERIVELDTNHAAARRALGYSLIKGQWLIPEDEMTKRGYVRYKGTWKLPQEVELIEASRKRELAEKRWFNDLKKWRAWLDSPRGDEARREISAIKDPDAAKALVYNFAHETRRENKMLFIEALGHINSSAALDSLALAALEDRDEEVRIAALDKLVAAKYKPAVAIFIGKLKSKDNLIVNRAGTALGAMKDPDAVGPLVAALVTEHKFKIIQGQGQPGQTSATFGSGPGGGGGGGGGLGGFSFGNPTPKIIKKDIPNRDVLNALVSLSGVNFGFEVQAWKSWYAAQRKPATLNARRD